jgi:hypothetical protein
MQRATKPKPALFRLSSDVKQLLAVAACKERRSLTSMLEVTVIAWYNEHGIPMKPKGSRN